MASITRSIPLSRPATEVWDAVRDAGAVHERLAREFVVDTELDGGTRVVTFANGVVVRELLVSVDDEDRRIAYAVIDAPWPVAHHHASMRVIDDGTGASTLEWISDVAPDELAGPWAEMVDQGVAAMSRTLQDGAVAAC